MLENVKVAQIKKIKKQSAFIFEFCFWENPPHELSIQYTTVSQCPAKVFSEAK